MNDRGLFSPAVLGFLVASVAAIFVLSVILATIGGSDTPFRATTTSPSAIGYEGFETLLERLELPVATSRLNARSSAGRGGLLIMAEPDSKRMPFDEDNNLGDAPNVLVVLPKWTGRRDLLHDGWITSTTLLDIGVPRGVLAKLDKAARVIRSPTTRTWTGNTLGVTPTLEGQVQTMISTRLKPLIGTGQSILLGELVTDNQRIWVLADPDALENHGIANAPNADFALVLVKRLRSGNGRIVFDETIHGIVAPTRNPLQLLFQFPFVIVTGQILAALALLLFATTSRFGGVVEPPPPFQLGKARLIDNIAALMERAGHQAVVLRRYLSVKLREAGVALHGPAGADDATLAAWLDRVGTARGVSHKAAAILERGGAARGRGAVARLFGEARDIYFWQRDILDGSGRRPNDR